MSQAEFGALTIRLERAADALRERGCLFQSIARRYYIVYAYASQAAEKHGIVFRRGSNVDDTRRLTHQALPDIVLALYTGQNTGSVLGSGPRRNAKGAIDGRSSVALC